MLSGKKLTQVCIKQKIGDGQLAEHLARGGMSTKDALGALRNWKTIFRHRVRKMSSDSHLLWVLRWVRFQNGV
jgi:hypothetical protein